MVGITPNAGNHAGLPPQASRFVDVEALPWEPTRFPGIETKTLFIDKDTGSVTALIRMAPGARLPDHEHPLSEQSLVLEVATAAFPFSHVVIDGYAFLSGIVASDLPGGAAARGDIARETELVMAAIREALAHIGLGMERIVGSTPI